MPFLAIPEVSLDQFSSKYSTVIQLKYKADYLDKIIKQIQKISPETLLFLRKIREIKFEGFDGVKNINNLSSERIVNSISKKEEIIFPSEKVTIKGVSWKIFEREEDLNNGITNIHNELEFYQIKLAIREDLGDKHSYLFSYFPTNIRLNFPYIIHGTFDLDQNRNQLNDTEKNRIVLKKLVSLIVDTSKHLTDQNINWLPFKMLYYRKDSKNERLEELGFYADIDRAINSEKIFPCVDGIYRKKSEVINVDDRFSKMILEQEWMAFFPNVLIPGNDEIQLHEFNINNTIPDLVSKIDSISNLISKVEVRADFIFLVNILNPAQKFNLLIDEQGNLIDKNSDIYTPSKNELSIPGFCDIRIINQKLFDLLVDKFSLIKSDQKAREIQRRLKGNTKIHSYEPIPLAQKIISLTNEIVAKEDAKSKEYVREMVKSLFYNYKNYGDKTSLPSETKNIPLINKTKNVTNTINLFLSDDYPSGKLNPIIFNEIYKDVQYVGSPEEIGLYNEEVEIVEQFLLWLGVNKHVRISEEKSYTSRDSGLQNYYTEITNLTQSYNYTSVEIEYLKIHELNKLITSLEIEKVLLWLLNDSEVLNQLESNHKDKIRRTWNGNLYTIQNIPFSYIKYCFKINGYDFSDHLIDEKILWVNDKEIDYSHPLFLTCGVSKRDLDNLLVLLGAKDDFNDLSINRVTKIIDSLPEKFPDGKYSQTIYKKSLQHYTKNNNELTKSIRLFANNGDGLKDYEQDQIYFSDRIKIPEKLKHEFPIFNFPPRAGGASAIKFFGINNLSDVEIQISSKTENKILNNLFNKHFEDLKPYILVFRLSRLEKEDTRIREASILSKMKIVLCDSLKYQVNEIEHNLDDNEFIADQNNSYYIKVPTSESIDIIYKNSVFSDSFAEIISHAVDVVSDKSEYRHLLRDDIQDTDHSIRNQFGAELLNEARILLGTSDYEFSFWKAICFAREEHSHVSVDPNVEIENFRKRFKVKTDDLNYETIEDPMNLPILKSLFEELNISIGQFNESSFYKIEYSKLHHERLTSIFLQKAMTVKSSIWSYLNEKDLAEQITFLDLINKFENNHFFISKIANENKYQFDIDYSLYLDQFLNEKLSGIKMSDNLVDIQAMEIKNRQRLSIEEQDVLEYSKDLRSLIYFEQQNTYIKEKISLELEVRKEQQTRQSSIDEPKNENGTETIIIPESRIKIPKKVTIRNNVDSSKTREGGVYIPRFNDPNLKKRIGNTSEQLVYDELVQQYGFENVTWESKINEGSHYDLRYSKNDGKDWIYVEVKTFTNHKFVLTRDEKKFGENNSDNYELWLVDESKNIIPIKDFFSNSVYTMEVKDYEVFMYIEI